MADDTSADQQDDIWGVDAATVSAEAEATVLGRIREDQHAQEEAAERRHQEQLRAIERVQQQPAVQLVTAQASQVSVDRSRILGQGAHGAVYAGQYDNMEVAVKQVGGGAKAAPDYERQRRHFLREAEAQQNIRHRNLVQLLAAVPEKAQLVMELARYGSVKDILYGPNASRMREQLGLGTLIALRQKLAWIRDMLAGLAHLHKLQLVHRDIKADNLLLFADGVVKIADFGLAKFKDAEASMSSVGSGAKGTPMFLSPELLRPRGGEPKYEDFTDVYAAAITIMEIVLESPPFDLGMDRNDLERAIVSGCRPTLPSVTPENEELLGQLLELVQQAWSANPFERPTAQEMLDRVNELLQRAGGHPPHALHAGPGTIGGAHPVPSDQSNATLSSSSKGSVRADRAAELRDFILATVDGVEEDEALGYAQQLYDKKARTVHRLRERVRDDGSFLDDVFTDTYERRDMLNALQQPEEDGKPEAEETKSTSEATVASAAPPPPPAAAHSVSAEERQPVPNANEGDESKTEATGSPEGDQDGLVALYVATDGPDWKVPWDLSAPVETWHGVTIDPDSRRLVELDLSCNRLRGALPPEVGHWTALRKLLLHNEWDTAEDDKNQLTTLPAEVGNWTAMVELQLRYNQLTTLPAQVGKWTAMTQLGLEHNQLASLPAEVGNWTTLKRLWLCNNHLTTLPVEVENWTAMVQLGVNNNQLFTLPAAVGNWCAMSTIGLDYNQLTTLPAEVGSWAAMSKLWLSDNQLTTLPAEVSNWTAMTELGLNNNRLTTLPAAAGNWTAMTKLWLNNNQLRTLPAEVGNWTAMAQLGLDNNQLTALPAEIGRWTAMTKLWVRCNQLQTLPAEVGNWGAMTMLDLSNNRFMAPPAAVEGLRWAGCAVYF